MPIGMSCKDLSVFTGLCLLGLGHGVTTVAHNIHMEIIAMTITLGILAKFFERKLEKSVFEKEWVEVNELPVPEKLSFQAYS